MKSIRTTLYAAACLVGLALILAPAPATADQVILDDLIVDGSLCVGFDCVNGESFGFDTIRLKENNLRIHFDDTSSSASFPTANWRIAINDTSNGGANFFAIEQDNGQRAFKIENGAGTNALVVDDGGRVGIGTGTPVADVHIKTGNTPTLRLEQDGSSGFASQTWDVAGNEANFFIRDATNGSTLPFRIEPGASSNAIYIENDDEIGLGTTNPQRNLHIQGSGNTGFRIDNDAANAPDGWDVRVNNNGNFLITEAGSTTAELSILGANGNVTIENDLTVNGTIFGTVSSSRALKTGIEPVDARQVLAKVTEMPIATWSYKLGNHLDHELHLGPMAEDFYAAFGLGRDAASISLVDYSGVALAAIQGLAQEKDAEIEQLRQRLEKLEALLTEVTHQN